MTSVSAFSADKAICNSGTIANEIIDKSLLSLPEKIIKTHPGGKTLVQIRVDCQYSPKFVIDQCVVQRSLSLYTVCYVVVARALVQKPQLSTEQSKEIIEASKKYFVRQLVNEKCADLDIDSLYLPKFERRIGKAAANWFINKHKLLCEKSPKDAIDLGTEYLTNCGCFTNKEEARSTLESLIMSDHEPDLNVDAEFRRLPLPRACQSLKDACEEP